MSYAFFRPEMHQKLLKIIVNYIILIDKLKPESSSCAGDPYRTVTCESIVESDPKLPLKNLMIIQFSP